MNPLLIAAARQREEHYMRLEEQRIARGEAIQRQRRTVFTPGGEAETRQLIRNRLKEEEPRNQHYRQKVEEHRARARGHDKIIRKAERAREKGFYKLETIQENESREYSLMAKLSVLVALGAFLWLCL